MKYSSSTKNKPDLLSQEYDIVICVHNALDDLRRCIDSVFVNTCTPFRLIIVNDGSDSETSVYLKQLNDIHHNITLVEHSSPEGYTRSANEGLKLSQSEFIVLMNSDIIVPEFWLSRLIEPMLNDHRIGLVGPVSNAASWQSVPERFESTGAWKINTLPDGIGVKDYDKKLQLLSPKSYPEVPLLNGFCTLIRREVFDKAGYLDEETFPVGYGEENDFCFRAADAGYKLVINDSVYVFHAKSKSFGKVKRNKLSEAGNEALIAKYGHKKINEAVRQLRENSSLAELRKLLQPSLTKNKTGTNENLKILFLLPIAGLAGGIHSIVQEAHGMRRLGVEARIASWDHFKSTYFTIYSELDNKEDLFYFFNEFNELADYASSFDVVIATIHNSVILLKQICDNNPGILPAYYIQDYEPLFFEKHSEDWKIALESYSFVPGALLFAKTHWLRNIIGEFHQVNVEKVSPSLDVELYHPVFSSYKEKPFLVITAMVRPSTPRRGADRTMRVLKKIKEKHGQRVQIKIFGSQTELIQFYKLDTDFDFQNLELLTRTHAASLLRETDIFCDFSVYQAFGRTGLEAMACGCAVILPQKGGASEYASHLHNSLLVDTGDDEECFKALDNLITDNALREMIGYNGLLKASEYSIRRAAISEVLLIKHRLKQREIVNKPTVTENGLKEFLKEDKRIRYDTASIILCLKNGDAFDDKYMSRLEKSIRYRDDILIIDYGIKEDERKKFQSYIKDKSIYNLIDCANYDYAEGINLAMNKSDKPYFALMNYGIEFCKDWFRNLIHHFVDPLIGGVSPILSVSESQKDLIKLFKPGTNNLSQINSELNNKFRHQFKYVKMIRFDCAVFRRTYIDRIGGFIRGSKKVTELDICLSLRCAGAYTALGMDTYIICSKRNQPDPDSSEIEELQNYFHSLKKENLELPIPEEVWGITLPSFEGISFNPNKKFTEFKETYMRPKSKLFNHTEDIISIIIITYNQLQYTQKCIESIIEHTPENYELIIVDNASESSTIKYLEKLRAGNGAVMVIFNERNLGFPAAVNQGLRAASGKYVLLLNNDTIVTRGWLTGLIEKTFHDPTIGLAGPVSNEVSGIQKIKTSYNSEPEMHLFAERRKSEIKNTITVFPRIAFLCTLIKREVIDAIGGLDERFSPGNFEDDDFCLRAQLAGYKTIVANDVFIHHFGSKSFTADGIGKYKERLRINRNIFVDKWGAAPEEIWLKGADVKKRNILYPIAGNEFDIFYNRALIHIEGEEYALAQNYLKSAIVNYTEDRDAQANLTLDRLYNLAGNLALLLNDYTDSKKCFEKALNLNPESSDSCTGLAENFFIEGNYEASKIMFEWGLKFNPSDKNAQEKLELINSEITRSL